MPVLERLALENFDGLVADLGRYAIDCDFEATGDLLALTDAYQEPWLEEEAETLRRFGHEATVFDAAAMQAEVASPTYLGGVWDHTGSGIVDPGKLAAGLRDAALRAGVRVYEHSAVRPHHRRSARPDRAPGACAPAASCSPPAPIRRWCAAIRRYVVPVYDYALMTEPVDLSSIGWKHRQGIGDGGNQFHYYRLTTDNRILYGGWDAVYRYGGPVGPRHDDHDATFATLSQHFFHTFPQLEGTRFTHRWGGAIDTSSRFSVFFGSCARRPADLRDRLHRARRRRRAVRRPHRARPARRPRDRGHAAALRALQADPVPTRAAALGRDPVHAQPARGGRPKRRPPRALAQDARPPRARLRFLRRPDLRSRLRPLVLAPLWSATMPVTLSGRPAALRSFWAISAISSAA